MTGKVSIFIELVLFFLGGGGERLDNTRSLSSKHSASCLSSYN